MQYWWLLSVHRRQKKRASSSGHIRMDHTNRSPLASSRAGMASSRAGVLVALEAKLLQASTCALVPKSTLLNVLGSTSFLNALNPTEDLSLVPVFSSSSWTFSK